MIVSYKWLQTYFKEKLPKVEKLEEVLTLGAFEVENIEKVGDDYTLDIDVLPNRAHDCLSHRGIAKETSVLLGLSISYSKKEFTVTTKAESISVENKEQNLCRRYIGRKVEGVKVGVSPEWLRRDIETIGQKSINNIVDVTNYVMFDTGQPLHAFDADKVDGGIIIRNAKKGEKITTLDGKNVELDSSVLVIADEKDPLAIAGVKGGKKAEVDENTTNIILEAANFASVNIRKTSRRLNILTDSSKRFENEITPDMAGGAMNDVTALISEIAGGNNLKIGEVVDVYYKTANPYKVGISLKEINKVLGTQITNSEVEDIWSKFEFEYKKVKPLDKIKEIINSGELLDKKYKSGASVTYDAPLIFDCSSLTAWIFKEAGLSIPRISVDQFVFAEKIKKEELGFGDLIFSNSGIVLKTGIYKESVEFLPGTKVESGVDHLGMYVGDEKVLHTSSQTGKVVVESLSDAKMFKNIVGYGRIAQMNKERYVVIIPKERLDLRIKEDLIEEVGRVYGYRNIEPKVLEGIEDVSINKTFYYINKIRNILVQQGFSEVYTYSFVNKGKVEVKNPIVEDKKFLRKELSENLKKSIEFNTRYADLLGTDKVKIFEIGKVFDNDGEHMSLCIGVGHAKLKKGENPHVDIENILKMLSDELGVVTDGRDGDGIIEINFDKLVEKLPDPESYGDVLEIYVGNIKYKIISQYPFMLRDIAVWTPEGTKEEKVLNIIVENSGELLVQKRLFDRFEKDGRVSYAFNLVFQSQEKTLTDEEVNEIMDKVTEVLNNKDGWQVR